MPNPQKAKGSSWERDVAKYLSSLYDESFIKAPSSGAYIGGSNVSRKTFLDEGKIRTFKGDVIPGESFPLLNIEAKFYKDFPFHQMYSGECKQLDTWIDQILVSADEKDINILALKFNRKGSFIGFQERIKKHIDINKNYFYYHNTKLNHGPWIFTDFDQFWHSNKQTILKLNQAIQA